MSGFNSLNDTKPAVQNRLYAAEVVDNNDPLEKQRIKVTIPNLLEGDAEFLPWIGPLVDSSFGITSDAVTVRVPVIGSIVAVQFQDGDLLYGVIKGSLHTGLTPLPPELRQNYPNRRGWKDPAGNILYWDITDGQVSLMVKHKSGTFFTIGDSGVTALNVVGDSTENSSTRIVKTAPRIDLN